MDANTRRSVRERAANRCEYCGLQQQHSPLATLHVEHILPIKHDGTDEIENLCLACADCNFAKSSNVAGYDPETHQLTALFNPRIQPWEEHFARIGMEIIGLTPTGRTTVRIMNMNAEQRLELRAFMAEE